MDALAWQSAFLLALLSAPSFDLRETASSQLHQTPPPVLFLLAQSDDLEVRRRTMPLVREQLWQAFAADWDARGWPYVDSLEGLPWAGLDLPTCEGVPHETDWPNYKIATRIWARWQLDAGRPAAELQRVLILAQERSAYWRKHRQYP